MSRNSGERRHSRALIGAFIVGAGALSIIVIIILGGNKFSGRTSKSVLFFDSSVKGLNVGAPVNFRGATIGQVVDINIHAKTETKEIFIPVIIEIDWLKIKIIDEKSSNGKVRGLPALIKQGLRAQLELTSIITGKLQIKLDYFPDAKINLVGALPEYQEIPTIKADLDKFIETFKDLPFEKIGKALLQVLDGISKIVNSPELKMTIKSLGPTIKNIGLLAANANKWIDPTGENLNSTLSAIQGATIEFKTTMKNARIALSKIEDSFDFDKGKLSDLLSGIISASKTFEKTMNEFELTAKNIRSLTDKRSNERSKFVKLLKELTEAARSFTNTSRSIKNLTDYLGRHPEALIHGKGNR